MEKHITDSQNNYSDEFLRRVYSQLSTIDIYRMERELAERQRFIQESALKMERLCKIYVDPYISFGKL